jgi:hypothetical protein
MCKKRYECGGASPHDLCSECGKCPYNKKAVCVETLRSVMDNNRGSFDAITGSHFKEMLDEAKKTGNTSRIDKIFHSGETVRVKDSKFIIKSLDHVTGIMVLKLLPGKKTE